MKRGLPEEAQTFRGREVAKEEDFLLNILNVGEKRLSEIDVSLIKPNPDQPRKDFGAIDELVESVREKGIIEPIVVRKVGSEYQIVAGERRFRAFIKSGRKERTIPCVVVKADSKQALEISLIENLQRKDLNIWEESAVFKKMTEELYYSISEIAKKIGKSIGYVSEVIGVSDLPNEVRTRFSNFESKAQSIVLQALRAHKGGKLNEFMKELEEGKIKTVKDAKAKVDKMLRNTRSGRKQNWIRFKFGIYRVLKGKKGDYTITIKINDEKIRYEIENHLKNY